MSGLRVIRNPVDQNPLLDDSTVEEQPVDCNPGELCFSVKTSHSKSVDSLFLPGQ
jgi:hypothetical protein